MNLLLANFYERDLRTLIAEVNLFRSEENLWRTAGSVKNPAGNLVLHIIGGTNHLIGKILVNTPYVRNRDLEFTQTGVPRSELVAQLESLINLVTTTLHGYTQEEMDAEYPIMFDDSRVSNTYVLTQLLIHLNYHLGQVNYLRRILEP